MTAVLINGVSLATRFGLYVDRIGGWLPGTAVSGPRVTVLGRAGGLRTGPAETESRRIEIGGTIRKDSASDRRDAERGVADLVRSGRVRLVVDDGLAGATQIEGRLESLATVPFGPSLNPLAVRITAVFRCDEEPYWRDVEPRTVALATAGTRYPIPLGTAPSSPIIRLMGTGSNPVLTYRDAGGAAVHTLTTGSHTLASDEYLDLDMRRGKAVHYDSGVADNPTNQSVVLSAAFPFALDPQDGDYGTSAWPTLEVSAGSAEVLYWRRWL